ncbi:MAG: creatininase family protein [Planctomycetota bacterium]|nr:creatininase family protein [Planctomycetota bacterium]
MHEFDLGQIPTQVNHGHWLTAYTRDELLSRIERERIVLPVCSIGTPAAELESLGSLVLPPLYHEAMDEELKTDVLARIGECFPFFVGTRARESSKANYEVVELPRRDGVIDQSRPEVLAFSVDTAVEEHGPHIPLATDTIQSYAVLRSLRAETPGMLLGPPVDYGHLTWGLPFGVSIDLTPPLVTRYVRGFADAVQRIVAPQSMYVVDVHGSIVHREAIQAGLRQSSVTRYAFRWLHDPLVAFSGDRGDQHAGGVETALVEFISADLVDSRWWPKRVDELAEREMSLETAVGLHGDLPAFIAMVEERGLNGIVGGIRNYFDVDADLMMRRMLDIARSDVDSLLARND